MIPSALRILATSILSLLDGATATVSCRARAPLRNRVSRSAIGSATTTPRRRAFFCGGGAERGRGGRSACGVVTGGGAGGRSIRSTRSVRSSIYYLPARLRHAGELSLEGSLAETDPAQPELPHVRPGTAADATAVVRLHLELWLRQRLQDVRLLRHYADRLNGMPRSCNRRRPSSSVRAVVTRVISMPRKRSILSYSISGNTSCSRRPSE